jgi:hypothetical protein
LLLAQDAVAPRAGQPRPIEPKPIDFTKVDRTAKKLPKLSDEALYGIYLFGNDGETRVLAVLDKSAPRLEAPDVLWLDKNANGDLTEPGERITGGEPKLQGIYAGGRHFEIGAFRPPRGAAEHADWSLDWTKEAGVRFKMKWRGEKVTMGGYGPRREDYAGFSKSLETAPVFVPGWDRPFQFERWLEMPLLRGQDVDFKVFVGNCGDRRGTFSTVDDKFVPIEDSPIATLLYVTADGKQAQARTVLKLRC